MMKRSTQWAIAAVLLVNPWTLGWALQTWWSAATPQGQVVQACRAAHLAVIEVGAGATPTRCYRTTDAWGREGRCYLQVYEPRGALPLALATEAPANSAAASITNAAGEVATQVWRQLLPLALEGLRWVEVFLGPDPDPHDPGTREARFAEVTFSLDGQALHSPRWRHMTRAEVEALIGGAFNVPFASSY